MPILNFEYQNADLHFEAVGLSEGIKTALSFYYPLHITEEDYLTAVEIAENLTTSSMLRLRELFPKMRITAHFLPLHESRILDAK